MEVVIPTGGSAFDFVFDLGNSQGQSLLNV